jgi:assimilatory nitrate reductase electron transfer subunit
MRTVVVGSGMAATRLVEHLVALGAGQDLTVIGDEPHAPYNRILLSAVLEGSHDIASLTLRSPQWYAEAGVDLRLGTRVLTVDLEHSDVMLVDGTTVGFDRLILATGSIPTLPPIRGMVKLDGRLHERVHAFRGLDDCTGLLQALPEARRAVVIGGGLLGLQVARALAVRGLETEVVEGGEHVLRSQVHAAAGAIIARDLTRLGTTIYTGSRVTKMRDGDHAAELVLDNGVVLDTDLVVLASGGRPATALARRVGLEVRRGIVVDDQLRTSHPRIHALGDCAQHGDKVTGFVPPAWEQAEVLARVLAGQEATYDGSRTVARLRASGLDVAVLGDPLRAEGQVVEVSNPVVGSHRRLVISEGMVVAATLVGDLSRIGLITQHYDRRTVLGPDEPGALLLPDRPPHPQVLGPEAEVCACAGVDAQAIRACGSLDEVRERTRATTGCGSCTATVCQLLSQPLLEGTPR